MQAWTIVLNSFILQTVIVRQCATVTKGPDLTGTGGGALMSWYRSKEGFACQYYMARLIETVP